MDAQYFDLLARTIAGAGTRRGWLRLFASLPVAALLARLPGGGESEAVKHHHRKLRQGRGDRRNPVQDERKKKKNKKKRRRSSTVTPSPSSTCAQTCTGCCAGQSCQAGTSNTACGANGAPCAVCGEPHSVCLDGACRCDVCANGCQYPTVQAAVEDPAGPTTVRICAGTYNEDVIIDRDVTLLGAGDGDGPGDTILKGTGSAGVVFVNSRHIVTLERLRITGGNASGGGGIQTLLSNTMTLRHCTVSGNKASVGGGIFIRGTLTLDASHVTLNEAAQGGGVHCQFTDPTSIVILQNGSSVTTNTANVGGGISSAVCQISLLSGSSVSGNTANLSGGGISNTGTLTLNDSDIADNTAATEGGGIDNSAGGQVILLNGSSIAGNKAKNPPPDGGSGGGIFNKATVASIDGTFAGNSPDQCVDVAPGTGCPPS